MVGALAAIFLGLVFLVATWAKAVDPEAFAEQIASEGLAFLLPAMAVALVALALEAGLGVALLLNLRRLWVLLPAVLLVLFFLFLTGRNYWLTAHGLRAEDSTCGCFGNLVERTPAEAFWQDLLLLGLPVALAFVGRPRSGRALPPLRTGLAVAAAAATVGFAWQAPELPLDDLATRLSPGTDLAQVCAGRDREQVCFTGVLPEIEQGEHLVVMAELDSPELTAAVDRLNAYAEAAYAGGLPALWVVSPDPPEAQHAFFWRWGPSFEIREAPPALLAPLYRRLPRSFVVRDGEVTATYPGLPPLERLAGGIALASENGAPSDPSRPDARGPTP